jgi:hypothetical protein
MLRSFFLVVKSSCQPMIAAKCYVPYSWQYRALVNPRSLLYVMYPLSGSTELLPMCPFAVFTYLFPGSTELLPSRDRCCMLSTSWQHRALADPWLHAVCNIPFSWQQRAPANLYSDAVCYVLFLSITELLSTYAHMLYVMYLFHGSTELLSILDPMLCYILFL